MSKSRRDPAELAALIEQGVARGLDLVDSWRVATGKAPKGQVKALAIQHRRELEANRKSLRKHRAKIQSAQSQVTGGAVVAGVGGAVGLFDVIAELTASSGAPGPAWMWLGAAGLGLFVSIRGRMRLHRIGPEPHVVEPVAPPPSLPRGRMGAEEVSRLTSVRVQVMTMAPALDRLYPGAGDELRRADAEAAGPLTALAERLVVLDQLQRELPGTSAARQASASADVVRGRLADGCDTYDELLAAAARLLAAPDAHRSTAAILGPAVNAMLAYAHGLQRAADL
ncbi:MAG: hypothetical protein Q8M17_12830 [Actinomycetota bacterium]|nr:hypothetical protein [Actinomycetota bacterium]